MDRPMTAALYLRFHRKRVDHQVAVHTRRDPVQSGLPSTEASTT